MKRRKSTVVKTEEQIFGENHL